MWPPATSHQGQWLGCRKKGGGDIGHPYPELATPYPFRWVTQGGPLAQPQFRYQVNPCTIRYLQVDHLKFGVEGEIDFPTLARPPMFSFCSWTCKLCSLPCPSLVMTRKILPTGERCLVIMYHLLKCKGHWETISYSQLRLIKLLPLQHHIEISNIKS